MSWACTRTSPRQAGLCPEGTAVLPMTARNRSRVSAGVLPRCSTSRRYLCASTRKRVPSMPRIHHHWFRLAASVRWAATCSTSHCPHRMPCRYCSALRSDRYFASAVPSARTSAHRWSSGDLAIPLYAFPMLESILGTVLGKWDPACFMLVSVASSSRCPTIYFGELLRVAEVDLAQDQTSHDDWLTSVGRGKPIAPDRTA